MHELTLRWIENGQIRTETLHHQQPSKNPGTIRIGRDPSKCDIVLHDPTVSGLHIEIFFNPQQHSFVLRNLRETNPPLVNGQSIGQGEVVLSQGSLIHLGQLPLTIAAISLVEIGVPATLVIAPPPIKQPLAPQPLQGSSQPPVPTNPTYGLQCPNRKCGKTSPYSRLDLGCPWCGTSLAAAVSILVSPNS